MAIITAAGRLVIVDDQGRRTRDDRIPSFLYSDSVGEQSYSVSLHLESEVHLLTYSDPFDVLYATWVC